MKHFLCDNICIWKIRIGLCPHTLAKTVQFAPSELGKEIYRSEEKIQIRIVNVFHTAIFPPFVFSSESQDCEIE